MAPMPTRNRRRLFAGLAVAAPVVLGVVGLLAFGEGPVGGARRRAPLGGTREAIEAAVGRPGTSTTIHSPGLQQRGLS
jgi:hypothetical protein